MRVLVACEYSGRVRDAFIAAGHDAMSCDLLPTDAPGPHYQGDVFDVIDYPWDLMIAHPPCTHLSVSGAAWFEAKRTDGRQQSAASFFMRLIRRAEHIKRTAIENPISVMSSLYRKPDQIIQPWMFGHPESKATCLWLKGLPVLKPTNNVFDHFKSLPKNQQQRIHYLPPSADRWKERSKTFEGVAKAMVDQWTDIDDVEIAPADEFTLPLFGGSV
jgi:site-specific DNA-cytosine methylase